MPYATTMQQLNEFRRQIAEIRASMQEIQAKVEPEAVADYEFSTIAGPALLSEMFGDHDTLFIIHNMGAGCRYCTLWADGFNGIVDHLENRAGLVVSSPDSPEVQHKFARSRGWIFKMVSHRGTSFAEDMGYTSEEHGFEPGISVFKKDGDRILRVSDTRLGPGDPFCSAWHFFDLLPEGANGWEPQYRYSDGDRSERFA